MTQIQEATRIVSIDAACAERPFREFSCTDVSFLDSAALVALAPVAGKAMTPDALAATAKQQGDPLLDEWTGPHGGTPRFDMVKVDAFQPAMMRAVAFLHPRAQGTRALRPGDTVGVACAQ
jgi:hypothetical protein